VFVSYVRMDCGGLVYYIYIFVFLNNSIIVFSFFFLFCRTSQNERIRNEVPNTKPPSHKNMIIMKMYHI